MTPSETPGWSLSPTAALRIDDLCDRFEARWAAGDRPPIEAFVAEVAPDDRPPALLELLRLELALRRGRGEVPDSREYRARFPGLEAQVDSAFASEPPSTLNIDDGPDRRPTAVGGTPAAMPALPASAPPGYEILSVLGRGGMGVVYRAHQIRLKRDVALKMVLAGDHASSEAVARFLAEAEAIARLKHPNVVQVFDLGDHDGRPYFAMEYLARGSLARQLDGTPRPPREAAALVERVARGVAEAHRLGIVHRDIKPANVLIADDGTPRVADFGLAKTLDTDSGLTRSDLIVGTPTYMAPEQALGKIREVGPAADVHALGALLYESLTGRPPFRGASALETLEQVRSTDPVPPRRLVPGISRDAETICLKCLQKDPGRRYASAEALADDLRALIEGRPIKARPVGPARRGWLWCRRRPATAALLATLAASVAVGSTLAVALWLRAEGLRARAEASLVESDRRLGLAMEAVEQYYTGVSDEVLLDQPELNDLRLRLLRTPLEFYRQLGRELRDGRDDPAARGRLVETLINLGELTNKVGTADDAIAAYRQAIADARRLSAARPRDPAPLRSLGKAMIRLGELQAGAGLLDEARATLDEAMRLHERLGRLAPGDPSALDGLASCLHFSGDIAWDSGRLDEAEAAYRRGIGLRERLVREHPDNPKYLDDLAATRNNRAIVLDMIGRPAEAEAAFRASLADRLRLVQDHPDSDLYRRKLSSNYNNLGSFLYNADRPDEALPPFEEALGLQQALVRDHPTAALYQFDLAISLSNLGLLDVDLGRDDRAADRFRESRTALDRLARLHPDRTGYGLECVRSGTNLGWSLYRLGDLPAAERAMAEAVAAGDRLCRDHPDLPELRIQHAQALAGLAGVRESLGRSEDGRASYRAALDRLDLAIADAQASGPVPTEWLLERTRCRLDLGRLELAVGRLGPARAAFDATRRALGPVIEQEPDDLDAQLLEAEALLGLASCEGRLAATAGDPGRLEGALESYAEAEAAFAPVLERQPDLASARRALAWTLAGEARALAGLGRLDEAASDWDRALELAPDRQRPEFALGRLEARCRFGDPLGAVAEADRLAPLPEVRGKVQPRLALARLLAVAASVTGDPALAGRAEAELLAARGLPGFGDGLAALETLRDPDFAPILGRPAVSSLIADLGFPRDPFAAAEPSGPVEGPRPESRTALDAP